MASNTFGISEVARIKKLHDAEKALKMLEDLRRYTEPLVKARGWRVHKVYEICCCTSGGRDVHIGGFCCAQGDGCTSLRIALRLRRPRSHDFIPFDSVVKVMLHELAHIVHQNHSAAFYCLMDSLTDQYRRLLKDGLVTDQACFPLQGGRVLDDSTGNVPAAEAKARARVAAEARAARAKGSTGRLGGGGLDHVWRTVPPREAAAKAAERRRAEDEAAGLGDAELGAAKSCIALDTDEDNTQPPPPPTGEEERVVPAGYASRARVGKPRGAQDPAAERGKRPCHGQSPVPLQPRIDAPCQSAVIDLTSPPQLVPRASAIHWAAPGKGTWQAVGCPMCGPLCIDANHDPSAMPEQDADEGAMTSPLAAWPWLCARCTLANDGEASSCDACGHARACGEADSRNASKGDNARATGATTGRGASGKQMPGSRAADPIVVEL